MSQPVISEAPSTKAGEQRPAAEASSNDRNRVISLRSDRPEATSVPKWGPPSSPTLHGENLGSISSPEEKLPDDGEIDVFDAAKYFEEELNSRPEVGKTSEEFHDLHPGNDHKEDYAIKQLSPTAAMSIRSGFSRNNCGWLMHARKLEKRKILAALCCNFSCADKNSVDHVAENSCKRPEEPVHQVGNTRDNLEEPAMRVNSHSYFSFPLVSRNVGNETGAGAADTAQLQKWSSIPEKGKNEFRNPSIPAETHEDESDASSDLFEIDSLCNEIPLNLQHESDCFPSGTIPPANAYPPSEASIDWSVVTGSVTEFSVMSNSDKLELSTFRRSTRPVVTFNTSSETPKLRPRILSGCNSGKAVGVVRDAHRAYDLRNSEGRKQQNKPQPFPA